MIDGTWSDSVASRMYISSIASSSSPKYDAMPSMNHSGGRA